MTRRSAPYLRWYLWLCFQPMCCNVSRRIFHSWQPWQMIRAKGFSLACWGCPWICLGIQLRDSTLLIWPKRKIFGMCSSRIRSFTGEHCSSETSQELILLGSGDIVKCVVICCGKWRRSIEVSSLSSWCQFQERASAMLFSFPTNYWLYAFNSAFINNRVWWRAASAQTAAWTGSSPTSLKLDLHIHPSAVVLSVINKAQSPNFRWSASKSIQGVIIAARYSSRLLVAQNWRGDGTWKCHARPWLLYPPSQAGHESE